VPEANIRLPEVPDNRWVDTQFNFNGQWMPDVDGALIGPNNYQEIENLRYKDAGLEGVNGYHRVNTTPIGTYTDMTIGHQLKAEGQTISSYVMCHMVNPANSQGRVYLNTQDAGSDGDFDTSRALDTSGNAYWEDNSTGLQGRFSDAPQGNIVYCNSEESVIFGGDEQRLASAFLVDSGAETNPIDYTDELNNNLDDADNRMAFVNGSKDTVLLFTTRPIKSINVTLQAAASVGNALTLKTWTGSSYAATAITDNTNGLRVDGTVVITTHSKANAVPKHYQELFLYSYELDTAAGTDAVLSRISVNFAMQTMGDVWDGVYRQPIQFQFEDNAAAVVTYDYTLQVNESSDVNLPVGGLLDGMTATDYVYIMFEDQMSAIRFTMLGDLVNTGTAVITLWYWDGSAWGAVTNGTDGTKAGAVSFAQTGTFSWSTPSDEKPQTAYGSFGYMYRITVTGAMSGSKGGTAETLVDVCTGIPAQNDVQPFDFSALYGSRLMLCSFSQGEQRNRMDYTVANAPDVLNGFDSSDAGRQSLFFGNNDSLIAATQLYNRFGANVFSMLLVLKRSEVYILVGSTPEDFTIYPVAKTIGCVAPMSLATAEVGIDLGQGLTRNVAMWLSHSGPMMFDGAVLTPIPGIRSYFDPEDARYIDFDLVKDAKGWIDPNFKEYNLLIPSGSAAANNVWLVYDLIRRKWYTKKTGNASFPQTGFEISSPSTGQKYTYGGIAGGLLMHLESGTTWDDSAATTIGITQRVKTGDFFPSGNIWDETVIRKFKIFIKKLTDSGVTNNLEVIYYTNTEQNPGSGVIFQDSDTGSGIFVDWEDAPAASDGVFWESALTATIDLNLDVGLQRLIRIIQDLNRKGWSHAFEFTITTTDITKGFQPVAWGIQYRVERKDNTSTG
jgi:hypothetical protein